MSEWMERQMGKAYRQQAEEESMKKNKCCPKHCKENKHASCCPTYGGLVYPCCPEHEKRQAKAYKKRHLRKVS